MSNMIEKAKKQLNEILLDAMKTCVDTQKFAGEPSTNFVIEIPADTTHGDFATNIAMINAKSLKLAPKAIATEIVNAAKLENSYFKNAEIAGPGFINFFLKQDWFSDTIDNILNEKDDYGKSDFGQNEKIMVEFVSANPTGPMHLGNARGGALGDCLASMLDLAGYDVTREFLINDSGNQINKLGLSIYCRYMQIFEGEENHPFPEDGYHGQDIIDKAERYKGLHGDSLLKMDKEDAIALLIKFGLEENISTLRKDLEKYRIVFDVWFSEQDLHDGGKINDAVEVLKKNGYAYEKDGAIWYKDTAFGSDKDEVIIRSNGVPTYFAADIAYHYNKFVTRNFSRVINVWGADHHGHVSRLQNAVTALGLDGEKLDTVLMQLVRLSRDGETVRMSKRTGKSVTLSDLLDEIPIDAARFFFNLREPNVHLEFDLGLAVSESSQNPVYYVQYAHARICSIIKKLQSENVNVTDFDKVNFELLSSPEEIELIRNLAGYTDEIIASCVAMDPSKITRYAITTATLFHKFYNAHYVKGENAELTNARLALCISTKIVIKNILTSLKITIPDSM